jgi:hypothetical protein
MKIDLDGVDEQYLGADQPFERMIVLYVQIYERMMPMFDKELSIEEWDTALTSLDMIVEYLSKIKSDSISVEFKSMRDMYLELIQESINEIEKAIEHD